MANSALKTIIKKNLEFDGMDLLKKYKFNQIMKWVKGDGLHPQDFELQHIEETNIIPFMK